MYTAPPRPPPLRMTMACQRVRVVCNTNLVSEAWSHLQSCPPITLGFSSNRIVIMYWLVCYYYLILIPIVTLANWTRPGWRVTIVPPPDNRCFLRDQPHTVCSVAVPSHTTRLWSSLPRSVSTRYVVTASWQVTSFQTVGNYIIALRL